MKKKTKTQLVEIADFWDCVKRGEVFHPEFLLKFGKCYNPEVNQWIQEIKKLHKKLEEIDGDANEFCEKYDYGYSGELE